MKRMLVTGGGGMVGSYVRTVFTDHDLLLTDKIAGVPHLDVRDSASVAAAVAEMKPDAVLHLAAATDVDRCEQDPEGAFHTNAVGTQNVALACQAHDIVMVYVSTAGVFWGDKPEPYHEFDDPRPANVYGRSKLAGEQIVMSLLRRYYIVRAGWMFGGGARDKKFVGFITRKLLAGEPELRIVADKFGSPTYGKDLLYGIRALLETGYYGLYHMTNTGIGSRYEVALAIRRAVGREDVPVRPMSSAYFPLPAPRARSEAMDNLKLRLLGLNTMRPWRESLAEYVRAELVPALAGVTSG